MKKILFLFLSMLLPMAAMAAYTDGTINITMGNSTIAAQAQIDHVNHVILLGNGRNACIQHYTEGIIFIPGTIAVH